MRDARIREQTRNGLAPFPPSAFLAGGVAAALLVGALGWASPVVALVTAIILLLAFGLFGAALRRDVRELADRDPLTGVASRSRFANALHRAVQGSTSGSPVTVAVLDCDDFKRINEQFGHTVGDTVLIDVARVLSETIGQAGTVGRLWGDAFGVVLPGTSLEAGRTLLDEAERRLRARMIASDWPLTFSIGVSCQRAGAASAEDLLAEADALMFSVKRRGRNGIACCGPSENSSTLTERQSPELARQP
jgi:diguanylate cyclase (GGDEF)-like protein